MYSTKAIDAQVISHSPLKNYKSTYSFTLLNKTHMKNSKLNLFIVTVHVKSSDYYFEVICMSILMTKGQNMNFQHQLRHYNTFQRLFLFDFDIGETGCHQHSLPINLQWFSSEGGYLVLVNFQVRSQGFPDFLLGIQLIIRISFENK